MPMFRYVAITPAGDLTRGTMDAPSEAAVVERLRRRGNITMRAEPEGRGSFLGDLLHMELGARQGLRWQEVANFTRELAVMLSAGQDLDRALRFLVETAGNRRARTIFDQLRNAVRDGSPLAAALAQHPRSFPPLYVGLVRAGEAGGTLAATLERLATLLERQRSLAATISAALVYPILLTVVAIGSVTLLLTEVLPQFVPLFEQNSVALPRSTQLLISAGHLLSNYGLYLLAASGVLILGLRSALRQRGPRLLADRLLLRLPVAGTFARELMAARFSRTLGTLLQNGVPLITALGVVRDTIGNLVGVAAIDRATISAKAGAGLAGPLGEAAVFPLRTIYLLRLGEETAQLGSMALRAADIHEEKTRIGIQRLVALLVPVITIVMGVVIASIVSSLLLAMLSLNDLAQ